MYFEHDVFQQFISKLLGFLTVSEKNAIVENKLETKEMTNLFA